MADSKELNGREFTPFGLSAIIIPNIGWGLADVCIVHIGRGQVVTWVHTVMGAVFLFCVLKVMKQKLSFKDFLHSFPYGITKAISWGATFYAFQQDNPAIAITIMSFSLVVGIVVFGPMLGEKITLHILMISLVGVIGIVLTSNKYLTEFSFSKGAVIALCILPLSASATFILRNVQKKVNPSTSGFYMYMWVALIYTFIIPFLNPRFEFTSFDIFVLIFLMVVGSGGHVLFGISQKLTTFRANQIASIIHIPVTAVSTWIFLGGTLKSHQIVGMIIVIAAVAYMSISSHKKAVEESLESQIPTP